MMLSILGAAAVIFPALALFDGLTARRHFKAPPTESGEFPHPAPQFGGEDIGRRRMKIRGTKATVSLWFAAFITQSRACLPGDFLAECGRPIPIS
jgi:hypothetical protein